MLEVSQRWNKRPQELAVDDMEAVVTFTAASDLIPVYQRLTYRNYDQMFLQFLQRNKNKRFSGMS